MVAAGGLQPTGATAAVVLCDGREATIVGPVGGGEIVGTEGPDVIVGLEGNDVITALGGDDVVCAGAGGDTIDAGSGDDRVFGGPDEYFDEAIFAGDHVDLGLDPRLPTGRRVEQTVDFSGSAAAVRVDLGPAGGEQVGVARGEGDDTIVLLDALSVVGSTHDDVILGSAAGDHLDGGPGADVLTGGPGADEMSTRGGTDTLLGGPGVDSLAAAGAGPVTLLGNAGRDRVVIALAPGP